MEELNCSTPVPISRRLALYRSGFLSRAWDLYDLDNYPLEAYVSDWDKAKMSLAYESRNPRAGYEYGVNNKIFSTALLGQHVRVPIVYASIENGTVIPLGCSDLFQGTWQAICDRAGGALVFKPTAGGQGKGVFVIELREGVLYLNGVQESEQDVQSRVSRLNEYIVVEYIRQAQYANELFPLSTNTIRIITILDPDTATHYMPIAMHRIGRKASAPTDNSHRGGVSAEIDCETGKLCALAARDEKGRLSWHEIHPETGSPVAGVQVPGWSGLKDTIMNAAEKLSFYKFMSWDVVVTDGGIVVIEADVVSGLRSLQQHRPLLLDDRFRRFMEHHKYIKPRSSVRLADGNALGATKPA